MSEKKLVRVRDVMKNEFDMVDGKMTVKDVLKTMKHIETKSLLVKKRHEDDEYGMVLLSDIAKHVLAKDRSPDRVNIYEIMSKPVISVRPGMDIRYCARLFDRFGLSRAPVIDGGEVVGIISFTDMVLHGLVEIE
ncbi:MAG: CBS domain-containing protein [Gammaproteobacteria bacterium]|nr:CBS domain-containing protein [Gammaproteobacteria bacterium]MCW8910528.1 CBS domain-containing protein [Gammaproteobacteria bacterium]MCW9004941.1 CBS domain-containing protein [Gammaproteobacteria bacterium]MCW9056338.1 CBS domain-containing protein [Gammaproteobacteria bacterium]